MPNIEISEVDYDRLKAIAEPFTDTPASVISRLLDFYSDRARPPTGTPTKPLPFWFTDIPPLTHTKVLHAEFNGATIERNTWDSLLRHALSKSLENVASIGEVRKISGANIKEGRKNDEGYKYIDSLLMSYQGVSAEDSMRIVRRVCKYFNWECRVIFEWRDKDESFLPGRRANILVSGDFVNGGTQ